MKNKSITTFLLVAVLAVYVGRTAGQRSDDHSADSSRQGQTKSDTASPGMMGQGMMGMMGQMKGNQQQMFRLMEKLMASLKAIEDEKDPAALKSKLAEHQALLNQMHEHMTQQGGMMSDLSDMMMKNFPTPASDANAQNVMGTVKAISADSITVETIDKERKAVTVTLLQSTRFIKDGAETSVKDLKVGDRVIINTKPIGDKLEAVKVVFGQVFQHMDMHH